MALVVKDDVKISEFINLSTAEKFLPAVMTSVKTVRISKVDKVIAMENDSLSDVDLLNSSFSLYAETYLWNFGDGLT